MSTSTAIVWLLLPLLHNIAASTVYKSYTSDVTKAYPGSLVADVPLPVKSFATATAAAGEHAHGHLPCKKKHYIPKFFISAPKRSYRSYFYPGQTLPAAVPQAVYYVAAPPAAATIPEYIAPQHAYVAPQHAYVAPQHAYAAPHQAFIAPIDTAKAASYATSYYNSLHAAPVLKFPFVASPHAHATPAAEPWTLGYNFVSDLALQQGIQQNFAI